ncbi:MAG: UDP-N-acetylglucosamine 2-epimerase (hydrolyzing) [Flavobacteriales bacterium]|nr:UDP-N-acetylglucosamine 2-epimerase (hydrolyzing) [Flavobacteriales bacterium]
MRVSVLTSSRADYGIYLPLLKRLKQDPYFELEIIAFGTHLSPKHGNTINQIEEDGFSPVTLNSIVPDQDDVENIDSAINKTTQLFNSYWDSCTSEPQLVLCLGDRYEMFAAIKGTLASGIPIGHIHGGEYTPNSKDNEYRNALTTMAQYHFTSTQEHADRVAAISRHNKNIWNIGTLSLDNLSDLNLLGIKDFFNAYGVDLSKPTILFTFHPESISVEENKKHILEINQALRQLPFQIIVTMPNVDAHNKIIRKELEQLIKEENHIWGFENLGTLAYFSCMKHCAFVLGNSSSGIIEAPSLKKYFINLGNRQIGRQCDLNVINCRINAQEILRTTVKLKEKTKLTDANIYRYGDVSDNIIKKLKTIPHV